MHIILGASGHVGSVLAESLLKKSQRVTVILRDPKKKAGWERKGAVVSITNIHDTAALHEVFCTGQRLFLLNPPANISVDTVAEEQKTLASILQALEGSAIRKIVAESTYGAQPGTGKGDLGVLYDMEQALAKGRVPASIIRAAYYMSNWDASLKPALDEGKIYSFYPPDFKLPMIAPYDIAQKAAVLMTNPIRNEGLHYVEGPERYCAAEVARAFSNELQKPVEVVEIPAAKRIQALKKMGFSEKAAESFSSMTSIVLENKYDQPANATKGRITIEKYIQKLVATQMEKGAMEWM